MSDIGIKKIEISPNTVDDGYDVSITYVTHGVYSCTKEYTVSVHTAVEYCLSATKKFNSLYISALERALQLFNWDVLSEQERKGADDSQIHSS